MGKQEHYQTRGIVQPKEGKLSTPTGIHVGKKGHESGQGVHVQASKRVMKVQT